MRRAYVGDLPVGTVILHHGYWMRVGESSHGSIKLYFVDAGVPGQGVWVWPDERVSVSLPSQEVAP